MSSSLKAQDVLVVLKLLTIGDAPWSYTKLGNSLGLSVGATHNAVAHLRGASLIYARDDEAVVSRRRLFDYLVHGVPASFYAVRGGIARGIPTAFSAPSLVGVTTGVERKVPVVWPLANGKQSGETIAPIYETAPSAAAKDPRLYEYLALVDALRIGKARERKVAAELLEVRILGTEFEDADEEAAVEVVK